MQNRRMEWTEMLYLERNRRRSIECTDRTSRRLDQNGDFKRRNFSLEYFADIHRSLGVVAVVTAGDDRDCQCAAAVAAASIGAASTPRQIAIPFHGGAAPPPAAVVRFFRAADAAAAAGGMLAVQSGMPGRGPTGTLAALLLMRSYDFTAREAIAWVRMMLPVGIFLFLFLPCRIRSRAVL